MRSRFERLQLLSLVLVCAVGLAACPNHTPAVTSPAVVVGAPATPAAATSPDPALRQAQIADAVVIRLSELQNAAIDANHTGGLSDHDAVLVVRFTVSATKVVRQVPLGYLPTLKAGYAELKMNLPPPSKAKLAGVFALIDALIGVA